MVSDKAERVASFHRETIINLVELVGAAGLNGVHELRPKHINRRVQGTDVKSYAQLFPSISEGCLLENGKVPEDWQDDWSAASAQSW